MVFSRSMTERMRKNEDLRTKVACNVGFVLQLNFYYFLEKTLCSTEREKKWKSEDKIACNVGFVLQENFYYPFF